eukprot:CAMPEP_0202727484 /NCGR_PEP_ID=MMETSP1385-20130828/185144_1 /ASSEMBLY_ACC=CAM_ASM_000861 /TAXON_ID=933848 /ORGANISM="Elphidium margaritaceum" /LENGTH=277 /DNA_ID=CAMNT_0049393725 /DNA_START=1107 /DNA_END=1941 /DNA_ORIENTATION=-
MSQLSAEQQKITTECTSDDLEKMKQRVAAIQAEANRISGMVPSDDEHDKDGASKAQSVSSEANARTQSDAQSKDEDADHTKSSKASSLTATVAAAAADTSTAASEGKENEKEVAAPQGGGEWANTPEEQQSIDKRSIFVKNVALQTDAEELRAHFESCGTIERITICCDKRTGQPKGCAYIQFKSEESVSAAQLLDGKDFNGKPIMVAQKRTNLPAWLAMKAAVDVDEAEVEAEDAVVAEDIGEVEDVDSIPTCSWHPRTIHTNHRYIGDPKDKIRI